MSDTLPQDHLNVAFMTSGARLYFSGYKGILTGDSVVLSREEIPALIESFQNVGGSPIGSSRVKLTNVADCVKRGYIQEGGVPLEVAAEQLKKDGVNVLHTIGGDDTNTQAAQLSFHLAKNGYGLQVIGMPKTIDNDVYPIVQSLGAMTAAAASANFFKNVVNESTASPRMLIIHEIMGRHCGYLAAESCRIYKDDLKKSFHAFPKGGLAAERYDVHALYLPEVSIDIASEGARLRSVMDTHDCVNIFLSEGAGVSDIIAEKEANGEPVQRDAFGHVRLESINPGAYLAQKFKGLVGAEKVLVQKSGYFARSSPPSAYDRDLIKKCAEVAVTGATTGQSGVAGQDEANGEYRVIEFERIKGEKPFDIEISWFKSMVSDINTYGANREVRASFVNNV